MSEAYFLVQEEDSGHGRYTATEHTAGPWDPRMQHGGPPSALLVRAAERAAADATGRADLVALRYAADFVGPVPVGRVDVTTQVVRAARTAVLVAASLDTGERPCLQARVWLVRDADTSDVARTASTVQPDGVELPSLGSPFPYGRSIEWRAVSGSISTPGPGVMWARPRLDLVPGERLGGLQRAVLVGDSASGISSELPWDTWSFLNVTLDVALARPLLGDWVCIDAMTQLGAHGSGLARSTLRDEHGDVGATAQTLVLVRR